MSVAKKALILAGLFATVALAHIGSPDVFFEGKAGPYDLLVAIRPPDVIPGVAKVEVRSLSPGVASVEMTPTPMTGEAAKHPPVADVAQHSTGDPQFFEGALWLMGSGSWKVRVRAIGSAGTGEMQIPVPAVALKMRDMDQGVTYFLMGMMVFLTVGMVALVGAGVRESGLEPGVETKGWSRRTIGFMLFTSVLLVVALLEGNAWWGSEASAASARIYKPLRITGKLTGADKMLFEVTDPGWVIPRKMDDLVLDHGHLMHLFLIRWPDMDYVYHLHPSQAATGMFELNPPTMPAGNYKVFADLVHESGLAETAVGDTIIQDINAQPTSGDDAGGPTSPVNDSAFPLGNGYRMVWSHDKTKPIVAKALTLFTFGIVGPDGKPVADLEPYMGMGGHAEFVKTDGTVFAHTHPSGSVSMAAEEIASPAGMMAMHQTNIGSEVSFPYGVPTTGKYRIFVQLKRAGKVETGAFDLTVQ